tara:strand:+ start:430 stop:615 length:186 start_codon:yes stop_codon:yes gene_type:complete
MDIFGDMQLAYLKTLKRLALSHNENSIKSFWLEKLSLEPSLKSSLIAALVITIALTNIVDK